MVRDEDERRVDELLDEMTVAEKVGQMVGTPPHEAVDELSSQIRDHHVGSVHFGGTPHNTPEEKAKVANEAQRVAIEESRHGIPVFLRAMAEHGHAAVAGSTVFPQQLGLAATRNPELVGETARVAAKEMRATGVQATSSPIGDIARDQRWGRIAETFGESPYLAARMTEAMVEGYQGEDLSNDDSVLAVTKHFPMYSEPLRGEDAAPNEVSEYTFRRIHLPSYISGIAAGTGGIMPCYNAINGEPVHGSKHILQDVLRDELGFEGFVLADYRGAEDLHKGHQTSGSLEESLYRSISAGIDILPSGGSEYTEIILGLVEDGELSEARIEESARRVLRAKFELGLFDDPYVDVAAASATLGNEEHRGIAREAARQAQTLLKNEGNVLPLSAEQDEVLVTGPTANNLAYQHGGWGNVRNPEPLGTTVLEAITDTVSDETTVTHERGAEINETIDINAARRRAETADTAVVCLGEPDYIHEFARSTLDADAEDFPSRVQLGLPEAQRDLVKAVYATGTPTVVVLITGRVLSTPWIADNVPGVLMSYQPGSEGGAVADVLYGTHNPCGTLPISVPRSEAHVPTRFNSLPHPDYHGAEGSHTDSYDPLFEYGHGLSYTEFEYEDITVSDETIGPAGTVDVTVTVANVGDRTGSIPVELFVRDVLSSRVTPVRELRGITRLEIDSGDRESARFTLAAEDLGVVRDDGSRVTEPGTFEIMVGDQSASFEVTGRFV